MASHTSNPHRNMQGLRVRTHHLWKGSGLLNQIDLIGEKNWESMLRSTGASFTRKSPAELLLSWKVRGKLSELSEVHTDHEGCDRDTAQKAKSKLDADKCRGAQLSEVSVGDTVLLRQDKTEKFSTIFNATPHKIISRTGNKAGVESPTGARYARNSTFAKKYKGKWVKQGTFQDKRDIQEAEDDTHTHTHTHTTDTQRLLTMTLTHR